MNLCTFIITEIIQVLPPVYNVSLSAILNLSKKKEGISSLQFPLPNLKPRSDLTESTKRLSVNESIASKEALLFWQKINKDFRAEFANLFESSNDIYSFAPEIANIDVPLRDSLEIAKVVDSTFKKAPLLFLKKPEMGLSGKVKFLRFKNDSNRTRWFAIKRPTSIFERIFQTFRNIEADLNHYKNNLEISRKVGNHPNFMKVHGITVKKIKQGTRIKPYLILEYIEGTSLRAIEKLNSIQNLHLLSQLKDALIHLYRLNLLPLDANHDNFLITK